MVLQPFYGLTITLLVKGEWRAWGWRAWGRRAWGEGFKKPNLDFFYEWKETNLRTDLSVSLKGVLGVKR